jgi:hypothetical protein
MAWFIHRGALHYIDEGDPPAGSVAVELPDAYLDDPERFVVLEDRVLERDSSEVKEYRRQRPQVLKLTQEEIAAVKLAFEEGRL